MQNGTRRSLGTLLMGVGLVLILSVAGYFAWSEAQAAQVRNDLEQGASAANAHATRMALELPAETPVPRATDASSATPPAAGSGCRRDKACAQGHAPADSGRLDDADTASLGDEAGHAGAQSDSGSRECRHRAGCRIRPHGAADDRAAYCRSASRFPTLRSTPRLWKWAGK